MFDERKKNVFLERFIYDPFGEWACYFAFVVNKFATFYWNFVDLLLMLVSVALARKFRHINAFIKRSVFTVRFSLLA
jgi:hypothetical protein